MSRGISTERRTRVEIIVRSWWGKRSTGSIAHMVNLAVPELTMFAVEIGLGPNTWVPKPAPPAPSRPRGFTHEQVAWALGAGPSREAALILGICGLRPGYPADKAAVGRGVA